MQLQLGARYEGYSSSIARPVIMGDAQPWMIKAINAMAEAEAVLVENLKSGKSASEVAKLFSATMKKNGHYGRLLYGPSHSLGLAECESPWIEEQSELVLEEGMTFGLDIYLDFPETRHGMRLEDTVCVGKNMGILMTHYRNDVICL